MLNLDHEVRARLKELGEGIEFKELVTLISDQAAFNQHIQEVKLQRKRKTAGAAQAPVVDNPIDQLDLSTIQKLITS